jgi:hypothetical protein
MIQGQIHQSTKNYSAAWSSFAAGVNTCPMKLLSGSPSPACFDYTNEPPWVEFVGVEEHRIIDATNKVMG